MRIFSIIMLMAITLSVNAQFSGKNYENTMWNEYAYGECFDVDLWPQGIPRDNGIDYSKLPENSWEKVPKMQVSLPSKKDKPTRAVIICPGGAYIGLALIHEGLMWHQYFKKENIAAITLTYRLPHQHSEVPANDVYQAIRIIKEHSKEWNIDPSQIGIMGSSAGGHLASTVATHAPDEFRPAFQILLYPVITMDKRYTHDLSRKMLIGDHPTPEVVNQYSNEKQVDSKTPPAFIVLADDDDVVSPVNSAWYYAALKEKRIPANLHVYPKGGHGFGMSHKWNYNANMLLDLSDWLCQRWK